MHIRTMPLFLGLLTLPMPACFFGSRPATASTSRPASPSSSVIPQASKDTVRVGDQALLEQIKQMDEHVDQQESELKKAVALALGKAATFQGGPMPYPASEALAELRKAKIALYFAPVLDAQGKPVADQFIELRDAYTDRVVTLSRKIAEQKATPKEMQFVQEGAKYVIKLNDLKGQVHAATRPAMQAGWIVTSGSLTTLQMVSHMVRTRRQLEMQWTAQDYELVQSLLESQRRREALAAVSIGLLASYQLIIASKKADPKLLDEVANSTLQSLPLKGEASIDEAEVFVTNFDSNVDAAPLQYEAQLRKTHGDTEYEAKYKAQIDQMFAQIKSASSAKSASELRADTMAAYQADLQKCARGEKPEPGSLVGPDACNSARAKAGRNGKLSSQALAELTGDNAVAGAKSLAKRGLEMAIDKIPGGSAVRRSLEGIKALREGDPSKALQLAADLVPMPGPAKMALGAAAKIAAALGPFKFKRLRNRHA